MLTLLSGNVNTAKEDTAVRMIRKLARHNVKF